MRTTFDTIWRDLSPFTIGFDRTFDTLSLLAKNQAQNVNYPPCLLYTSDAADEL